MNHHFVLSWLSALGQAAVFVVLAWPLVAGARRLSATRLSTWCRLVMGGTVGLAVSAFVLSAWPAAEEGGAAGATVAKRVSRLPAESDEAATTLWRENGEVRLPESSPSVGEDSSSGKIFAFIPRWTLDPALGRTLCWLWLAGMGVVALPWWRCLGGAAGGHGRGFGGSRARWRMMIHWPRRSALPKGFRPAGCGFMRDRSRPVFGACGGRC